MRRQRPLRGVTAGSCATDACEPGQGRKAAALSSTARVPQTAWPSLPGAGAGAPIRPRAVRVPTSRVVGPVAYQSLYRRYRPQKFSEIKGQDHVVRALQTAVRTGKVGHAYLLHGPRGSGKTSTARVLAKALNCTDLGDDGEPCCVCESCLSIQAGRSFDLQELDAASNNKVDDMRGLLERVNLTSPGRAKVYLLDEVHMLTAGAENALLKTLEEPPDHVTWVLATTEPHKVVHTIRSRCQVFELGLIGADIMSDHLRHVVADAELDVDGEAIDHAVAAGGGSVRDSLTALERIVAGGGTTELDSSTDAILKALAEGDRAAALSAVGERSGPGTGSPHDRRDGAGRAARCLPHRHGRPAAPNVRARAGQSGRSRRPHGACCHHQGAGDAGPGPHRHAPGAGPEDRHGGGADAALPPRRGSVPGSAGPADPATRSPSGRRAGSRRVRIGALAAAGAPGAPVPGTSRPATPRES